ncbi:OmpA family protein [Arthrobacter sp. ISL-85]|uniref:OmpA family protein n=1 Tax=Arthrobacter sp. ISL-85 TaxID=2819115 RepID=UPI001BE593BB|nr:OmpA family protein [Arthrobacter sp. ISL-85]MBT2565907.1 OmpA family protein [Arthrobacter sp. ISL-85]
MRTTPAALTVTGVLAAFALTACDGPAIGAQTDCDQPTALSIIVAAHSNAAPALPAEVACMVRKSIEAGKPISIIREDGEPSVIQAPRVYTVGAASKDNDINNAKITVSRTISGIEAQANGDNPIAALEEASRLTTDTPDATIAAIGPGLSDQAPLDLTDVSLATAVPAEVTAKLVALKAVPALAGRTVHWYGLGEQHGTQPALTGPQRQNYQDIYNSILTTAGAKASFHPGPANAATETRAAGGHSIRPVPRADQPAVHIPTAGGTQTFNNASALGFLPDSTTFRDPGAAQATGEQLKKWLDDNPGGTVTVTGTTASAGTKDSREKLSLARAQAVCALAVTAGADPARLKPIGAGNDFPEFKEDILPNGALDPGVAEGNRTTKLHFDA